MKFGENLPRSFFETLKSPSFHSGDFTKFQKSELGKFIPNFPLKYVITSTKHWAKWQNRKQETKKTKKIKNATWPFQFSI